MAGFRRIFQSFPGYDVLSDIESANVIDVTPPGTSLGAGTGVLLVVGEFERGALEVPTEIFGAADLTATYGSLGFATALHAHDGAVAIKSGGDEFWNGNGFVYLRNKRYSGLIIQRVDNSAGSVAFSRLACVLGGAGPFNSEPGRTIEFTRNGSVVVTATVTATAGLIQGASGTYPTLFTGGETLEIRDGTRLEPGPTRVITMTAAEQSRDNVLDRINAVMGLTIGIDGGGGELDLQSSTRGADGRIETIPSKHHTQRQKASNNCSAGLTSFSNTWQGRERFHYTTFRQIKLIRQRFETGLGAMV